MNQKAFLPHTLGPQSHIKMVVVMAHEEFILVLGGPCMLVLTRFDCLKAQTHHSMKAHVRLRCMFRGLESLIECISPVEQIQPKGIMSTSCVCQADGAMKPTLPMH